MKKTITTFASLAIAATAAAHTTPVPHTHSGFEMSWQTVFAGIATAALAALALYFVRKKFKGAK